MKAFDLHWNVIENYQNYILSFLTVKDKHIEERIKKAINENEFIPDPLFQFNPSYKEIADLDDDRIHLEFEVVFDLGVGGNKKYFARILANLEEVGLGLDNIYAQNLVTDYQKEESSKNKAWVKIAQDYIKERRKEFEDADPTLEIPVLLTSELLYKALLNPQEKRILAKEFYHLTTEIPIPAGTNKLPHTLIPFYRHPAYTLGINKEYAERIKIVL